MQLQIRAMYNMIWNVYNVHSEADKATYSLYNIIQKNKKNN